ncbi:MAG: 4Fe-4S dicluster domain-containing protein [Acidimicrobiia bacterium]|jgi:ferredoxin-type protein NapF
MNEQLTIGRRAFLERSLQRAGESAVNTAREQVNRRATHWIRPPFAVDELEFLLSCTRCGACTNACPYGLIFSLPARLGAQVVGTPALDLLNGGCHLCEDWSCVAACEPGALNPAGVESGPRLPRIAEVRIDTAACLPYNGPECGACAASCPVPGAMIWDGGKPRVDPEICVGCGMCREACIVEPKAVAVRSWYRRDVSELPSTED